MQFVHLLVALHRGTCHFVITRCSEQVGLAAAVSSLIPWALLSAKGFLPTGKTNATFWWNHTRYLSELWSCKLDSFFISGGWVSWYNRGVKESWTVFLCYCHSKPAADLKQECAVWSSTSGWNSCQNLGLDLYSVLEQILVQLKVILYTVSFQFLLWRWCVQWSAMTIKSIFQSYIFKKVSGFKQTYGRTFQYSKHM